VRVVPERGRPTMNTGRFESLMRARSLAKKSRLKALVMRSKFLLTERMLKGARLRLRSSFAASKCAKARSKSDARS